MSMCLEALRKLQNNLDKVALKPNHRPVGSRRPPGIMLQNEVYQIRVHGIFESAHFLYDYYPDGTDEELHGHTWEAEVFAKNGTLKNGISVDFLELRKDFESLMKDLDHICINDHPDFKGTNPTAENIARYIYTKLKASLSKPAFISEVRVWEGPKNYASYFPGSPSPDGKA